MTLKPRNLGTSVIIYIDGSSRGNPGPASIGIVVFAVENQKKPLAEFSKYIGITTNNVAEYEALIYALKWLMDTSPEAAIIKLDSELVYKQITGKYRVKSPHIAILSKRVQTLRTQIKNLSVVLIPRNENKLANRLAQKASKVRKVAKKTFKQEDSIKC